MKFTHDIGEGYALTLYSPDHAAEMHALILNNIDRLRQWEPWAQTEQTVRV